MLRLPAVFPPHIAAQGEGLNLALGEAARLAVAPMKASAAQTGKGSCIHRRVASGCFWNRTSLGTGRTQKGTTGIVPGMVPRDGGGGRINT